MFSKKTLIDFCNKKISENDAYKLGWPPNHDARRIQKSYELLKNIALGVNYNFFNQENFFEMKEGGASSAGVLCNLKFGKTEMVLYNGGECAIKDKNRTSNHKEIIETIINENKDYYETRHGIFEPFDRMYQNWRTINIYNRITSLSYSQEAYNHDGEVYDAELDGDKVGFWDNPFIIDERNQERRFVKEQITKCVVGNNCRDTEEVVHIVRHQLFKRTLGILNSGRGYRNCQYKNQHWVPYWISSKQDRIQRMEYIVKNLSNGDRKDDAQDQLKSIKGITLETIKNTFKTKAGKKEKSDNDMGRG